MLSYSVVEFPEIMQVYAATQLSCDASMTTKIKETPGAKKNVIKLMFNLQLCVGKGLSTNCFREKIPSIRKNRKD